VSAHRNKLVQESEELRRVGVLLCERYHCSQQQEECQLSLGEREHDAVEGCEAELTVEVVMPDVEVVDAAVGKAWRHVGALLLLLEYKRQEALDGRRGDVVPVRALDQRL
jgi:hypothetical protein